jgi:DNA polymerase
MDEGRRLGYLTAMGVVVWVPRQCQPESAEVRADTTAAASVPTDAGSVEPRRGGPHAVLGGDARRSLDAARSAGCGSVDASVVASADAPAPTQLDPVFGDLSGLGWDALENAVSTCRACRLCDTRTQTVFGVGCRDADLMIIGEAPGADEDRLGEPFVGRAGQLLNRMLASIGHTREQVYIANVIKCRPPGNRDPHVDELSECTGYLMRQIELVRPRLILCVGGIAARHLLGTDVSVGRLRGRWFEFGDGAVPLRVTYHPAYLLRSPEQKAKAWDDLLAVVKRLREGACR